jgi:hypothetical protein
MTTLMFNLEDADHVWMVVRFVQTEVHVLIALK